MSTVELVDIAVLCAPFLDPAGELLFELRSLEAEGVVVDRIGVADPAPYFVSAHAAKPFATIATKIFEVSEVRWSEVEVEGTKRFTLELCVPRLIARQIVDELRDGRWRVQGGASRPVVVVSQDLPADRTRDLGRIHALKRDAGLDDDTYRDVLRRVASVDSSKDLDAAGRRKVIWELTRLAGKRPKSERPAKSQPPATMDRRPIMAKIGALLADQKLPWEYAHGIAKQMFKRERLQWCDDEQLRAVVTALVKRGAKELKGRDDEPPRGAG